MHPLDWRHSVHSWIRALTHGSNRSRCVPPCFQRAPATALPFADGSFDAVMSTDVLEHLAESEVDAAVGELTRVRACTLYPVPCTLYHAPCIMYHVPCTRRSPRSTPPWAS